ncbi:protein GRIM REAPER-like [Phoenix dactylifera]|uniref:Protein GRIM REAPER-like n=1 Tax=Phoenix dactylifera TaxID=42345 RepID=A0A8B7CAR4_PHODC|nr:protein GRIM REAPER-like [Phoenix dactylifera]
MAAASLSSPTSAVSILSMIVIVSTIAQCHIASAMEDSHGSVMTDHFLGLNSRSGGRFLAENVKKGEQCDPVTNNICSGTGAKDGTQLLDCCKNHCRDVLGDRNNCGICGNKCKFGQLCCSGKCTAVAYDVENCGKCGKVCNPGVRCEYGSCGYA